MFVTRRNSDLHQIACDFLTVRNRVGVLTKREVQLVLRQLDGNYLLMAKDRTTTLPEHLKLELPDYLEKIQK